MKTKFLKSSLATLAVISTLWSPAAQAQKVMRIQDYPGLGNFLVRVANANGLCEKKWHQM